MWKQLSLTVGVCFGVGLGLAPSVPVAHASKCNIPGMSLELEAIEGDADPDPEEAYWSAGASIWDTKDGWITLALKGQDINTWIKLERP